MTTTTATTTPQTVSFVLTVSYRQIERPAHLPETVDFEFSDFCEMSAFFQKQRRRRKLADRATSAEYRQVLTDHGREMLASDDAHYSRERYRDAIDGTLFKM
jgi:hypothetical protein